MPVLFIANRAVTTSEVVGIAAAGELFGVPRYVAVMIADATCNCDRCHGRRQWGEAGGI